MQLRSRLLVLIAALFIVTSRGNAQPSTGTPYMQVYDQEDYKAHFQNWGITQDTSDIIYVANGNGILEYDGEYWRKRKLPNGSIVRSIASNQSGDIFVGGQNELGILSSNMSYRSLLTEIDSTHRDFNDVWETHVVGDTTYFITDPYVFVWDGDSMSVWESDNYFHVSRTVNNRFYIREEGKGMLRDENGKLSLIDGGEFFKSKTVYSILPISDEQWIFTTGRDSLFLYDGNSVSKWDVPAAQRINGSNIYHGIRLENGLLALATLKDGIFIVNQKGRIVNHFTEENGLSNNKVHFLYEDSQGGLWAATDKGLTRLEYASPFLNYGKISGLEGRIEDIIRYHGQLLIATSQGLFKEVNSNNPSASFISFKQISGTTSQVWDLAYFKDIIIIATNSGLYTYDGDNIQLIPIDELQSATIYTLKPSSANSNWIHAGLINGIHTLSFDGSNWAVIQDYATVKTEVRTIAEHHNNLWLGTPYKGVLELSLSAEDDFTVTTYDTSNGLPTIDNNDVYTIDNRILISNKRGLYQLSQDSSKLVLSSLIDLSKIKYPNFLKSGNFASETPTLGPFYPMLQHTENELWFAANTPIRAIRNKAGIFEPRLFPTTRVDNNYINTIYPDRDSVVWFGGIGQLVRYDRKKKFHTTTSRALTREITITGKDSVVYKGHSESSDLVLSAHENSIRIKYAYPNFTGTQKEYRYKLDGFDSQWSTWTTRIQKEYTNLPGGDYTFQVQARNRLMQTSKIGRASFEVLSPWYATIWAYFGYGFIAIGIVYGITRLQALRSHQKAVEHIKKERRKAAMIENELKAEAAELRARTAELQAKAVEQESQRQTEELERARLLQQSFLPNEIPQCTHIEIAASQQTASEVGGDYFDFFHIGEDELLTVIGDATGHGVASGLLMTATKATLLLMEQTDIAFTPEQINRALKKLQFKGRMNMALLLNRMVWNDQKQRLEAQLAGGGIPPAYILRHNGKVEEFMITGVPLGTIMKANYDPKELNLYPGDAIIFLTDGLPECNNDTFEQLGYERLELNLRSFANVYANMDPEEQFSAQSIMNSVLNIGKKWRGNQEIDDDITVMVIKVKA